MINFSDNWDDWATISNDLYLTRLRYWRDSELARTDFTQIADAPVDKIAWAKYRQLLRDLPSSNADPRKIKFPTSP
jgi:hypothetical protein